MQEDRVHTPTIDHAFPNANVILMSHVGAVRDENQDYRGFHSFGNAHLVIVADGMGGHSGGFEASRLAVKAMIDFVTQNWGQFEPPVLLGESIKFANQSLQQVAKSNPQCSNMGTTIVAVLCFNNNIWLAHVGDSRAYVIRDNVMHLLSFDHTRVNRMLESGMISYENSENHPMGHILERSVGISPVVEPEVCSSPIQIQKGDTLLLCSDGLWGSITEADMIRIHNQSPHINVAAESMLNLALQNQADDNVTLALFEYTAETASNIPMQPDVRARFQNPPAPVKTQKKTVIIPQATSVPEELPPPEEKDFKKYLKWAPIPILILGLLIIGISLFVGGEDSSKEPPPRNPASSVPNSPHDSTHQELLEEQNKCKPKCTVESLCRFFEDKKEKEKCVQEQQEYTPPSQDDKEKVINCKKPNCDVTKQIEEICTNKYYLEKSYNKCKNELNTSSSSSIQTPPKKPLDKEKPLDKKKPLDKEKVLNDCIKAPEKHCVKSIEKACKEEHEKQNEIKTCQNELYEMLAKKSYAEKIKDHFRQQFETRWETYCSKGKEKHLDTCLRETITKMCKNSSPKSGTYYNTCLTYYEKEVKEKNEQDKKTNP